jgi:hypothetical protein
MQAIARQFPWARQQVDGTFSFDILRASLDVIGTGAEFGWWTEQPCCNDRSVYTWGFLLLEDQHIRERAGWKLPDNQIPWLDFALSGSSPPRNPPSFEHTWAEYYKWRGLPIQSPAALLLHWPLTVYKLLHSLGLVPTQPPTERRRLTVHLLGIEKELDFLPVFVSLCFYLSIVADICVLRFGELALLLPNTDLDLILFGPGVASLLAKARSKSSWSLASQPFVYTYTAQKVSGSGSIRIALSKAGPYWLGDIADIARLRSNKPDAMVALNSGLCSYQEWTPVVIASCAFAIPFATTDYMEVSLTSNIRSLMQILPLRRMREWSAIMLNPGEEHRIFQAPNASYQITLNPFMCPGPRPSPIGGGPSAVNGHAMIITPGVG